jgi:hypothetical protein
VTNLQIALWGAPTIWGSIHLDSGVKTSGLPWPSQRKARSAETQGNQFRYYGTKAASAQILLITVTSLASRTRNSKP